MQQPALIRASWLASFWALGYGLYRWYYALGGSLGILGVPRSWEQWRWVNAAGGALVLGAAVLPLAVLRAWRRPHARPLLLALAWIIAVGCASHALIGIAQRISSLAGVLTIDYPFWRSIDRREADLQALFFNEPWFLVEGLLWGWIAWAGALRESPRRAWWIGSAILATVIAGVVGVLSAFGVIGRVIVG